MNMEIKIEDLGYTTKLEAFRVEQKLEQFEVGRVIAEHKERYIVRTAQAEFEAEITGNMRFSALSREDFPAVGDWVALSVYDSDMAIIHKIFPRFSCIKRQAVGQFGEIQLIAVNIDFAFLVQAVDRDFNINRLERYLTICYASRVNPIVVLTKTDLIDELRINEIQDQIKQRIQQVPLVAISNTTQKGYESVKSLLEKGKTYCMLGSSGVGKSSLVNNLAAGSIMKTDSISQSTHKGRHITSHRELIVLENGSLLIDNPGMREVGITDTSIGLETTFEKILDLAKKCKFKDCTHTNEIACAVLNAVEHGEIDSKAYENFLRLQKEKNHFESTLEERRKKDKQFGKMIKNYKKDLKKTKL